MARMGSAPAAVYWDDGTRLLGHVSPDGSVHGHVLTSPTGQFLLPNGNGAFINPLSAYWSQKLPKFTKALAQVKSQYSLAASTAPLGPNVCIIGDSTSIGIMSQGYYGGNTPLVNQYSGRLAKFIANMTGCNAENWVGGEGFGTTANIAIADNRVTFGSNWTSGAWSSLAMASLRVLLVHRLWAVLLH